MTKKIAKLGIISALIVLALLIISFSIIQNKPAAAAVTGSGTEWYDNSDGAVGSSAISDFSYGTISSTGYLRLLNGKYYTNGSAVAARFSGVSPDWKNFVPTSGGSAVANFGAINTTSTGTPLIMSVLTTL